jgi:BON domain
MLRAHSMRNEKLPRSYALESDSVPHVTETTPTLRHSDRSSAAGTPLRTHLEVGFDTSTQPGDDAIASAVDAALRHTGYWHNDEITVSVMRGWVTLSGQIEWDYQKRTALYAVKTLPGVLGITDKIVLRFAPVSLTSLHVRRQALETSFA